MISNRRRRLPLEAMSTKSHIDLFFEYWKRQSNTIAESTFAENGEVYQKALFCSVIDAMATVAARGAKLGNREKFTKAVRDQGNWRDHSRISTPHLTALLDLCDDPSFDKTKEFVTNLPSLKRPIASISQDPE